MTATASPPPADKPVPPLPEVEGEKQTPGRRLSLLISKARKSIVEKVSPPEGDHPPAAATTTAVAGGEEETPVPATEKRKSLRFDTLFHRGSKAPAKEEEHETAPPTAEQSAAPAPPPKDNVVDQVKRTPIINRFFMKKEEAPDASAHGTQDEVHDEDAKPESPLVRRWTQILRSLPAKKKKDDARRSDADHQQQPEEVQPDSVHPAAAAAQSIPVVQATA